MSDREQERREKALATLRAGLYRMREDALFAAERSESRSEEMDLRSFLAGHRSRDEEVDLLTDRIADYEDDFRRVVNEECAPDLKHCSCVPHLRRALREAREAILKYGTHSGKCPVHPCLCGFQPILDAVRAALMVKA